MTHVSTLRLHQLRLGELADEEQASVRAHVAACDTCAARLGHQEDTRVAFLRAPVPALPTPKPTLWERLAPYRAAVLFAVPLAAAGLFVLRAPPPDEVHEKGMSPVLEAWVQTGESARPLYTNEAVRAGTRLQLKFKPGKHRFVTLAGRDGQGVAEVYATVPATGDGVQTAPFALTLDDSNGDQSFFAILTDTRPEPDAVLSALKSEPIRMDRGEVASLVVHKE